MKSHDGRPVRFAGHFRQADDINRLAFARDKEGGSVARFISKKGSRQVEYV